ncbi:ABC transporter substrate-binding protein [uncultured Paracoccus sp.]|uniref:ABC transporter substrate-binding protein n=1 Tax=uncultured Paracoccus sp. TaxID=189685 RepID=UPI002597DE0D|nr:ABC transporter substrate-binding protein [uncultured Paracoccus sp.]
MNQQYSLKDVRKGLKVAVFSGAAIFAVVSQSVAQETVTYGTDGGGLLDVVMEAQIKPAEAKHGFRVVVDASADRYPVVKAQVASGKPTWDVFDGAAGYCARGTNEGMFEPLDYSLIPNAEALPEKFKHENWLGITSYATVLGYNTETYGENGPKTWADFWDVEKFPGRRALRNYARPMLEIALLADGVAPEDLYPLDVDRAYAKLAEIKPHIDIWWTSGAETTQLLFDGEVDMIPMWDGRATTVVNEGGAAAFSRNQAIMEVTCIAVLKGSAHKDAAMKLIDSLLDPVGQAKLGEGWTVGPLNPKFAEHIDSERLKTLTTAPENVKTAVPLDAAWWASPAGEAAEARWLEFMQKG